MLVVLAIGLFAAEVKVGSYGLLTVAGLTAMILGAMMLVDSPLPELRIDPWKLLPVVVFMAAFTILLVRMVVEAQRRKATTGAEGLIGSSGVAATPLQPEGWVVVQGEKWRAQADGPLDPGARVEVVGMDGLRLRVRKGA
jgi:membrane-bound serine protease (ClpP class)